MEFRQVTKDDLSLIQELSEDYPEHFFSEELVSLQGLLETEGRAVALWREIGDIVWVRLFVVARSHRYEGLGRALLQKLETEVRESSRKSILFVVHRHPPRTRRISEDFLLQSGYRPLLEIGSTLLLDKNLIS